ncbi:MAG TPA: outer membrane beta-barrel protein [Chryseosolibacter sp.]|nr:outer membrane beta-barrel protein [Chryseosolibacter sp.]
MKFTTLSLIFFLLTFGLFAQTFEFEASVRPAITSLRGNQPIRDNFDPDFHLGYGLGGNLVFNNTSVLNVALLYEKKGGYDETTIELRDNDGNFAGTAPMTNELTYTYFTLPVQYGKRFGEKIQFEVTMGGYISYLSARKLVNAIPGFSTEDESKASVKEFDFGLAGGFNVYFPLNENVFFKTGITDLYGLANTSSVKVANDGSIKHNSLALTLALNVRF